MLAECDWRVSKGTVDKGVGRGQGCQAECSPRAVGAPGLRGAQVSVRTCPAPRTRRAGSRAQPSLWPVLRWESGAVGAEPRRSEAPPLLQAGLCQQTLSKDFLTDFQK